MADMDAFTLRAKRAFIVELRRMADELNLAADEFNDDSIDDDNATRRAVTIFEEISNKHNETKKMVMLNRLLGGRLLDEVAEQFEHRQGLSPQ